MLKIAMIGASGHGTGYCVPAAPTGDRIFTAVAPGSTGEELTRLCARIAAFGSTPRVYGSYGALLAQEKPDVVVVDNFYGEHAPVIEAAFRAGCHVFAEKPVAASVAELDALEKVYRASGVQFASMLDYRVHGAFTRARALIESGAIGQVRLMNAQKSYKFGKRPEFMKNPRTYGGTIPWVGIHAIDWILWMSGGRFESVSAIKSARDAENGVCPETTALALFQMNDGMMASLTVDYLNPTKFPRHGDDRIRIVGTAGEIEVRDNGVTLINGDGVSHPENDPDGDLFTAFLRQIADGTPCGLTADEVFASARGALMAQQAAESGQSLRF